jgi:hypothetical protein
MRAIPFAGGVGDNGGGGTTSNNNNKYREKNVK